MKYVKCLVCAVLLFVAAACKKDPGIDKNVAQQREQFLASTEVGAYQNGSSIVVFNKSNHQLGVSTQKPVFRITDNAGVQFVEWTLGAMPSGDQGVEGTFAVSGFSAAEFSASDVKLLKQEGDLLWLWSDKGATGMIVPVIEF